MLRIVLMRHGESTSDLEPRRIEGMADFPLSETGLRQADASLPASPGSIDSMS